MPPALSDSSRASSADSQSTRSTKRRPNKVSVVVNKANAFIHPDDVVEIVCHREHEFLVQWRSPVNGLTVKAYSWIRLEELKGIPSSINHVQRYVESIRSSRTRPEDHFLEHPLNNKKRKQSPLSEHEKGNYSNGDSATSNRSLSALDFKRDYNCCRSVKDKRIYVKMIGNQLDVELPTAAMVRRAGQTSLDWAEAAVADEYNLMLATFAPRKPRVRFFNNIDNGAPPLQVQLIDQYVYSAEVSSPDDETLEGCQAPCRPNMAHNCGCEYSRNCSCLEFAEVEVERVTSPEDHAHLARTENNSNVSTMGLPKRFPYKLDGTMQSACLESTTRYALYECNSKCNCGPDCKTKVTQRGRKYGLEIFKTRNRGWGLRCMSDLRKGDFVDMYYGRIITYKEAETRVNTEYLFDLDKYREQLPDPEEMMLVVDGTEMGGVTRFINHSCEPNCAIFPISYNKNDTLRYNLAFFALEGIRKGEELTFDYQGQLAHEYEYDANDFVNATGSLKASKTRIRCNCGTRSCRGYLFL